MVTMTPLWREKEKGREKKKEEQKTRRRPCTAAPYLCVPQNARRHFSYRRQPGLFYVIAYDKQHRIVLIVLLCDVMPSVLLAYAMVWPLGDKQTTCRTSHAIQAPLSYIVCWRRAVMACDEKASVTYLCSIS